MINAERNASNATLRAPIDQYQIKTFVNALFPYAPAESFVSFRAFDQFNRGVAPPIIRTTKIGDGLARVVADAVTAAQAAADVGQATVFAPPVCTFTNARSAAGRDLAAGLTLSVEIDDNPAASRKRLEDILGPATVIIESGSVWLDSATGELVPKLHMHWRLSEATEQQEDHDRLRDARAMAMRLIGADPTGVPIVHPLRWPGTWNVKAAPRMARIIHCAPVTEIHLQEATERLQDATEAAGMDETGASRKPTRGDPQTHPSLILQWLAAIPNADVHYNDWVRLGYACWRALGGDAGFDGWETWSRKSGKYDPANTETTWQAICSACAGGSAPRTIGAGTICMLAKAAGWKWTREAMALKEDWTRGQTADETAQEDENQQTGTGDSADIARLATKSLLEYDRVRIAEAERMGCRVATLDDLVQRARAAVAGNDADVTTDDARPPEFSDESLALRFAEKHCHRLRYVAAWGRWYIWTGTVWKTDETMQAFDYARTICRERSAQCNDLSVASSVAAAKTVAAVERLAKADRRHAATVNQWDADHWLLNTPGGVVDLRTGKMRRHRADDYMTKITAIAPGGDCPMWHAFLARVTNGDLELQAFIQRMAGYCLTGSTREHALFFAYGTGANGKGVTINTLTGILNNYAVVASMELFTSSQSDRHPTDLAMLRGARLVTAQETEEGRRWAEARIKSMTGGDPITARFMRQDFFTFDPLFKLLIAGNHRPGLRNIDEAIRRRFNMLPFSAKIPKEERDKDLPEKLKAEWPGILKWAIAGCLEWQRIGLSPPKSVQRATTEYLDSEDAMKKWLDECCIQGKGLHSEASLLYTNWKSWAEAAGEQATSQKRFSQALQGREFEPKRMTGTSKAGFLGIGLKPPAKSERDQGRYGDNGY